ncbi:MAG: RNA polymerase sigma factor [Clostridia bacterium]|nr:RNA polymerase sigma factor [Clostridia bacterium]MBQ8368697.1 RNA polymerase sigma factor [Clostridia bacterium]
MDFGEIYAEYFTDIYRFALGLCRDPDLAEEITQETFYRALKKIHTHDPEKSLSAWLCQIAKNTYYSHCRKKGRETEIPDNLAAQEDIAERLEDRESAFAVHAVLHGLTEPYKEVFWLRTFGELSFQQIGTLFGKSESWARVTYYRAKLKIREELK